MSDSDEIKNSSEYNLKKTLPPYFVKKELIEQLEEYFTTEIPKLTGKISEESKLQQEWHSKYKCIISDENGKETFSTISNFKPSSFLNETVEIKMDCRYVGPNGTAQMTITFSKKNFIRLLT